MYMYFYDIYAKVFSLKASWALRCDSILQGQDVWLGRLDRLKESSLQIHI